MRNASETDRISFQVLDFLKAKSPSLHTKAQAFYTIIEAKVAALGPEAKGFFMKAS